jgi:leader peptidase (prepilin peptidase)/N-methyltransferase
MTSLGWLVEPAAFPWVALLVGLCIGSFLNVLIHRLPKMMERSWRAECAELTGSPVAQQEPYNLFVPRSRCPSCGTLINALQNVPVISYAVLRGKCANCKAPISLKYPAVELLAGIGAAYSAYRFGPSLAALGSALFIWFTIALAFIDQETGFLPDDLTLPLVWLGLIFNAFGSFTTLHSALIGAVAGYLILWSVNALFKVLRGVDGMGHGDFKLTAAVGAFLGWKVLPFVILLSSVLGIVFGGLQMLAARRGWDSRFRFHFGPYLAVAGIVALLWGAMIRLYFPALAFYL